MDKEKLQRGLGLFLDATRTITVAYLAIVDKPLDARGMDDAAGAAWFPLNKLPKLAFDHQDIMAAAKKLYDSILQLKD